MDYKKMTETRQSCRAFDPVRTPDRAVLTQVLEAARLAPSACNKMCIRDSSAAKLSLASITAFLFQRSLRAPAKMLITP